MPDKEVDAFDETEANALAEVQRFERSQVEQARAEHRRTLSGARKQQVIRERKRRKALSKRRREKR